MNIAIFMAENIIFLFFSWCLKFFFQNQFK